MRQILGVFAGIALAGMTMFPVSSVAQNSGQIEDVQSPAAQIAAADRSALPAPPQGRSTVEGGTIRSVDPVRDQLTLGVYGAKPMKILFDERTKVYRDGVKASLSDLHAQDHAAVETVLDGTGIFAVSIHMLSRAPEGECQGQVQSYDGGTGLLTVTSALSGQPITLHVPAGTSVTGVGQVTVSSSSAGLQQLVKGTLVSVKFDSSNNGVGVARQIAILAAPGSSFKFEGNVTFLDMSTHQLVLFDPRDSQTYQIFFDPDRSAVADNLRIGAKVVVTAKFDGSHYVATAIRIN